MIAPTNIVWNSEINELATEFIADEQSVDADLNLVSAQSYRLDDGKYLCGFFYYL